MTAAASQALDASTSVVRMTGIRKEYPGVVALSGVDLVLHPGEIHALAGENGSGKSTLAKILYGAVRPDAGSVEVEGEQVSFHAPRHALERGIVGISQELTLAPSLTVTENVLMGRLPRARSGRIDWHAARRRARAALDQLEAHIDETARVGDLGIEDQQEVEIARAVSADSKVLVLDEATSSLSEAATERLLAKLAQLRAQGVAILFISHRLRELYQCATRVTVLRDGALVGCYPLPETGEAELVRRMVGRPVSDLYGKQDVDRGETLVAVRELTALDGTLEGATFEVRRGEIVGIAGLVGSGKAELGKALAGALPATGEVTIGGRQANLRSPRSAIRSGIGFVPEDRKREALLPTRSVLHNLSLAWHDRLSRFGYFDIRKERRMVADAVRRFSVRTRSPDSLITQLSGGNQQKIVLARWFTLGFDLIVLSEPTRGIDVGAKSEVYRLIQEMAAEGSAIVMISSELPELMGLADRILVTFHGRIRGEFDARTSTEEDIAHVALTGELPGKAAA